MADGLLTSILGAIDRQKQTTKAGLGLLADNPAEFARMATEKYFPTNAEYEQYKAMQKSGMDTFDSPYMQKIFNLAQFQGSIKPTGLLGATSNVPVNPAELRARKAIDDLVTQAKAYGIESPINYSNVPVGTALSDLNEYLGQSTAVANLPDTAKETLRNLFGKAESAGVAFQRVHGEDKLMGKLPEAANKGTLSTKPPWFSQELENKLLNKEITTKQYERQFVKNMENYFGSGKNVKPEINMQVDPANRFVFKENKNPDIILTTSADQFDPKYMNAYLEVIGDPKKVGGKGTATRLYLEALDVAKKNNMGWKSDTVTSGATQKMYERLKNMGIPFQKVDDQFILSPEQLSKIKLPKK